MRMYVIGGLASVLGLSLVGVDGRVVRDATELEDALDACTKDDTIGPFLARLCAASRRCGPGR